MVTAILVCRHKGPFFTSSLGMQSAGLLESDEAVTSPSNFEYLMLYCFDSSNYVNTRVFHPRFSESLVKYSNLLILGFRFGKKQ